jgi:hypothetical protein
VSEQYQQLTAILQAAKGLEVARILHLQLSLQLQLVPGSLLIPIR